MQVYHILSLCSTAIAATIKGSIALPDPSTSPSQLPSNTKVILRSAHHERITPLFASGEFRFDHVDDDSYVLLVNCKTHTFNPLRVDVSTSSSSPSNALDGDAVQEETHSVRVYKTTRGSPWSQVGPRQSYPIVMPSTGAIEYYIPRPSFNPGSMLKNPMVMIGLLMVVSIFGLPKLAQLLDPEGIEEMERLKAERAAAARAQPATPVNNPVEAIQNFDVSGWLAGKK